MSNMSTMANTDGDNAFSHSLTPSDAAWLLNAAFLVLTMQSGFGLLEAGYVSAKNVAGIMMKNVADVVLGGLMYWTVGYALSFGSVQTFELSARHFFFNPLAAVGGSWQAAGEAYTHYALHFSLASTATTIVSGAVAERMKFNAYMIFAATRTVCCAISAGWLALRGFHDMAGATAVHITGGLSAGVVAWMVGARRGRFDKDGEHRYAMSSPVTALAGTLLLWWAWLAFNCSASYGVDNGRWVAAASIAVNTLQGSIGGGLFALSHSWVTTGARMYHCSTMSTSVLAGLVAVTGSADVLRPWDSMLYGFLAAVVASGIEALLEKMRIDDPVSACATHFGGGLTSVVSIMLSARQSDTTLDKRVQPGVAFVMNGPPSFLIALWNGTPLWETSLVMHLLGVLLVMAFTVVTTVIVCYLMERTIGMRQSGDHELLGADIVDHSVYGHRALALLEQHAQRPLAAGDHMDKHIKQLIDEILRVQGKQGLITLPRKPRHEIRGDATGKLATIDRTDAAVKSMIVEELVDIEDDEEATIRVIPPARRMSRGYLGRARVGQKQIFAST